MELSRPMVKVVTGNLDSRALGTTDLALRQILPTLRITQIITHLLSSIISLECRTSSSQVQLVNRTRLLMVLHLLKEGTRASIHLLPRSIHPRGNTTRALTKPLPVGLEDLVGPEVILLIVALVAINPLLPLAPRVMAPLEVTRVALSIHPPPEAPTRERPRHLSTSLRGAVGIVLPLEGTNPERK